MKVYYKVARQVKIRESTSFINLGYTNSKIDFLKKNKELRIEELIFIKCFKRQSAKQDYINR